jgi:nucleotide-binding universal stress UspA family protein
MHEHPVIAGYRDPDSTGAVQLGAAVAAAVRRPLVVATAYRYEPVGLSAVAPPASGNDDRFDAAEAQAERAERLVRDGIDVRRRVLPAVGIATALADLARELDACALVVGRDVDARVTRTLVGQAPCPVGVALARGPAPVADPPRVIGAAHDGSPGAASR